MTYLPIQWAGRDEDEDEDEMTAEQPEKQRVVCEHTLPCMRRNERRPRLREEGWGDDGPGNKKNDGTGRS